MKKIYLLFCFRSMESMLIGDIELDVIIEDCYDDNQKKKLTNWVKNTRYKFYT